MRSSRTLGTIVLVTFCLLCTSAAVAQQPTANGVIVPRLIRFSGMLRDSTGKPLQGTVGITFALYKDEEGGAALWLETQNVTFDSAGHYSVLLGANKEEGLAMDLFTSGLAQWLGVHVHDQPEQPRVLLVSVPYALKAADADTIGGRPASAFVLAPAPVANFPATPESVVVPAATVSGSGTTNFVPLWTPDGATLGNSVLFQLGSGSTAKIGVNTNAPSTTLDVKGSSTLRGSLNLPATGTATATAGNNSQPLNFAASSFKSGGSAVGQTFLNGGPNLPATTRPHLQAL